MRLSVVCSRHVTLANRRENAKSPPRTRKPTQNCRSIPVNCYTVFYLKFVDLKCEK
ncbi:unnamed protein product [Acanthoscelides obtectus]|uniref:Uncharacterized protein n=1 Tax=Acanthoscelides obtectus TaxID=200917 RepID=A0A9P0K5X1_ACAOB|nr:unnamed protein product [Acanthoscelides obtectus]CAK1646704.1 hypothetical protein AOBTE_LOCUS14828 [Acanthoscelides obtectus]